MKIDPSSGFLGDGRKEFFIKGTEPTKRYVIERGYTEKPPMQTSPDQLGLPPSGGAQSGELF